MRLGVARPGPARRRHRLLPSDRIEAASDGGLRIGAGRAQQRPRRRPAVRARLSGALAGAARRRLRAAAQHGDRRRQPAAAHPLPLLPGRHQAVQQAAAGIRLPGHRPGCTAIWHPRHSRALRRDPPVRPGGRAGRARRAGARARPERSAGVPFDEFYRLPGDAPDARHHARARRADHRRSSCPAAALAPASRYRKVRDRASYAFAVGSVAAALDAGRRTSSRDARIALGAVAPRPWRARAAEGELLGRPADHRGRPRRGRRRELRRADRCRDNAFKVPLAPQPRSPRCSPGWSSQPVGGLG